VNSIKIVLIIFALLSAIVASIALPSRLAYRLLAAVFFACATGLIIFPDASTVVARHLGVGRGTDLLVYLGVFAGIHAFLLLYSRTRRLEKKLVEYVRENAIERAARLDRDPAKTTA
jgi:hypothetical protein